MANDSNNSCDQVKVLLFCFAGAKDRTGFGQIEIKLKRRWSDQNTLLAEIVARFPSLADIQSVLALAINEEYVIERESIDLTSNDVIALIPPISGG